MFIFPLKQNAIKYLGVNSFSIVIFIVAYLHCCFEVIRSIKGQDIKKIFDAGNDLS